MLNPSNEELNVRIPAEQKQVYILNKEEHERLTNCMHTEALINGAIPGAVSLAIGSYVVAHQFGFKAKANHLSFLGGLVGYVMGKVLYGVKCYQRIITDRLKAEQYGSREFQPNLRREYSTNTNYQSSNKEFVQENETSSFDHVDIGEYQPIESYDGFSSINGPANYSTNVETDVPERINPQKSTTYEELREKNRNEYKNKPGYSGYRQNPPMQNRTPVNVPEPMPSPSEKTKYGDAFD